MNTARDEAVPRLARCTAIVEALAELAPTLGAEAEAELYRLLTKTVALEPATLRALGLEALARRYLPGKETP